MCWPIFSWTTRTRVYARGKTRRPHRRGSVNADEFHVKLLGVRGIVRTLMESDLNDTQYTYLGAELHDLARVIIEKFALQGYRRRD